MSDATIASFVASSVVTERGATARLAQAFQALVAEDDRSDRLVELAEAEVLKTPLGRETTFEDLWQRASEMLLSYRDEKFVSTEYARELTTARTQAIDVERVSDDPPERIAAWLATVTDAEVRGARSAAAARPAAGRGRSRSLARRARAGRGARRTTWSCSATSNRPCRWRRRSPPKRGGDGRADRRAFAATAAIDRLAAGHLMPSMVGHLRTVDDAVSELAKALCHALGRRDHQAAGRSARRPRSAAARSAA